MALPHQAAAQGKKNVVPLNVSQSHAVSPHQTHGRAGGDWQNTKSQMSNGDQLDSTLHSYYNMQSVDLANRTLNLANGEQTGLSFQGRNQSMPASQKKHKKPNYEGMTKDQIK